MPAEESSAKLEGILHEDSAKQLILITLVLHHRTVLRIANEPGVTEHAHDAPVLIELIVCAKIQTNILETGVGVVFLTKLQKKANPVKWICL